LHGRSGKTSDPIEIGIGLRVERVKTLKYGQPIRGAYGAADLDRQTRRFLYLLIHQAPNALPAVFRYRAIGLPTLSGAGTFVARNGYLTMFCQTRLPAPSDMEADHGQDHS
jgi:hypothetical protein